MALNNPTYSVQPWHSTLLCWAVVIFGFLFNTVLAPRLPAIEVAFFSLHVAGWFGILVVLLAMGSQDNARDAFTNFSDGGDWGSKGVAAVITMANSSAMFVGYESPVHMCKFGQYPVD